MAIFPLSVRLISKWIKTSVLFIPWGNESVQQRLQPMMVFEFLETLPWTMPQNCSAISSRFAFKLTNVQKINNAQSNSTHTIIY